MIKIIVTKAKMHHIWFLLELRPRPSWGSSPRFPRPPSWIQRILLLRKEEEKKRERKEREKEKRGKEKGIEGKRGRNKVDISPPLGWSLNSLLV